MHLSYPAGRKNAPAPASCRRWLTAALAHLKRRGALSLSLVDEPTMQALNLQWRGKDKTTNVLSFPAGKVPGTGLPWLGDVVLCPAVVIAEAQAQQKTLSSHYAHLCVHGLLHLLGFDHQTDAQAQEMEGLEQQILAGLQIADPYLVP